MENTREKNKRADGRKKTYFDRENKKKAARTEKTKSVAPEKGKQKKSSSSSKCPYQKKCGGCTYLNLSYEEQLAKNEQFLKKTLKGIVPVKGMVGMENPYHYRNKVNSAFARKKDGTIISGIYEKGTHKVVPVDECLLEDQRADAIIRATFATLGLDARHSYILARNSFEASIASAAEKSADIDALDAHFSASGFAIPS